MVALGVVAGGLLAVEGVTAQTAVSPGRVSENYRLRAAETPGRGRDVPGLAVNPRNPNHIVELDADYLNGECDYHTSFDGGRTWTGGHLTARQTTENPPFAGTPPGRLPCEQNFDSGGYAHVNGTVVFGSAQNVYVAFSSHRGPFNRPESGCIPVTTTCPSPPREGGAGDDSLVARSTDGGRTFEPAVVAIPGSPNPQPFRIRPQVAVEPSRVPGGPDTLYANAWECHIKLRSGAGRLGGCLSGGGDRRMFVARSDDGGSTWTPPVLVSAQGVRTGAAVADAASPDEQIRDPAQPVVGPDGTVYVAWRNRDLNPGTTCPPPTLRDCIVVARSADRGQTWSRFNTGVTISGFINNPRLAIDPDRPAGGGTLYVTYQGPTGADFDIVVQRSTDRGQTWSGTTRVNDDPPRNNQSNPWISVAPDGRLDVVWHDQRHNYPGANLGDIYYASSTDGGATFSANHRVTDRSFNRNVGLTGVGGYTWYGPVSVPMGNNKVLVAWTDSREGDFNTGIQDVYLAQLDMPPTGLTPLTTMSTATGPGFSVALSRLAYVGGGEAVGGRAVTRPVVVNQTDTAGALAGAVLARASYGPLLLSPPAGLPPVVKADAARLEPVGGFVIGDNASLTPQVAQDLAATTGGESVERLAGINPPDTARLIAERMDLRTPAQKTSTPPAAAFPTVVIVNPASPEAASASAMAAFLRFPVLFVNPDSVPPETIAAINNLAIKNSTATNRALVIGGPTVMSEAVMTQLATALGQTPKRLGGLTQYDTSEAVVTESKARGMPANVVYVADGTRPIDGATLGATVGRVNGLMLLSPGANTTTAEASLLALGLRPSVDRLVSARGVGGSDPPVTTQDPGGPEETGGDPGRLSGGGADGAEPVVFSAAPARSTPRRAAAAAPPRTRAATATRRAAAPSQSPQAAPAPSQPAPTIQPTSGEAFAPAFPRAIGDQRRVADDDEDDGGVPALLIALILLAVAGAALLAWGLLRRRPPSPEAV